MRFRSRGGYTRTSVHFGRRCSLAAMVLLILVAGCYTGTHRLRISGKTRGIPLLTFGLDSTTDADVTVDLGQLQAILQRDFGVDDPLARKILLYEGVPLDFLMADIEVPKKDDLVIFSSWDGHRTPIPRKLLESEGAILAYGVLSEFENAWPTFHGKSLGPVYLVWPSNENRDILKNHQITPWYWIYQIHRIEFTTIESALPELQLASDPKTPQAQGGKIWFQRCSHCHMPEHFRPSRFSFEQIAKSAAEVTTDKWTPWLAQHLQSQDPNQRGDVVLPADAAAFLRAFLLDRNPK